MRWHEYLSNSDGISRVFGGSIPDLRGVQLHKIEVDRDGPNVTLHLDLPEYPENPPIKWLKSHYNTVRIEFCLVGVEAMKIEGISTEMVVDVLVARAREGALTVDVRSIGLRGSMVAAACAIPRISAYQNDV